MKMNRLIALLLALLMLFSVNGVLAETAETEAAEAETATITEIDPAAVLCTVNGQELTYADIEYYVNYLLGAYEDYGYDTSDASLVQLCRHQGLNYAIQYTLMNQYGEKQGIVLTDEEKAEIEATARDEWKQILEYYKANYYGISEASTEEESNSAQIAVLSLLEGAGYTESSYVEDALTATLQEMIQADICKDVQISDEDIIKLFEEKVAADKEQYSGEDGVYNYEMMQYMGSYYGIDTFYYVPEGYRAVQQILLSVDEELLTAYQDLSARLEEQESGEEAEEGTEPVTAEQVEAAKQAVMDSIQATVDEIMAKYQAGTAFEALIDEYNTDPGMMDADTRAAGYRVHAESVTYDPAFTSAAMSLEKIGDVSAPSIGTYGAYIVYYMSDIPGGAVEMTDEMKAELSESLISEKESDVLNAFIEEQIAASDIQYTEIGQSLIAE